MLGSCDSRGCRELAFRDLIICVNVSAVHNSHLFHLWNKWKRIKNWRVGQRFVQAACFNQVLFYLQLIGLSVFGCNQDGDFSFDLVNNKAINLMKTIRSSVVEWTDFYLAEAVITSVLLKFGCSPYHVLG